MAIIKTQIHPEGNPQDIIYPETSIDQVKGYVEQRVYNHYCSLSNDLDNTNRYIIEFHIVNNTSIKYTLTNLEDLLNIQCFGRVYSMSTRTYEFYHIIKNISNSEITLARYVFDSDDVLVEQTITLNATDVIVSDYVI